MRSIDWVAHRNHRQQIIEDHGQWVGLADEDGVPFLDLPQLIEMDWPEPRGTIADVSATINVRTPSGRLHPVVRELIAENLGTVDHLAQLIPMDGPSRHLVLERPGMRRRAMRIAYCEADSDAYAPHVMEIMGSDLRVYMQMLAAPSHPLSWTNEWTRFTRDWVGPEDILELFDKPRDLSDIKMFTVADGASIDGPVDEVIYRLISESLAAIYQKVGITNPSDRPYVAVLEESEIPPGPVPPPLYKKVSVYRGFSGWGESNIEGDSRLVETISRTTLSFSEDMVCDRNLIRKSDKSTIDAGATIAGGLEVTYVSGSTGLYHFTTKTPEILPAPSGAPYTIIRPTDQTIWDEVGDIALSSGVKLSADMWWPGDPQPKGQALTQPTIVFSVKQEG